MSEMDRVVGYEGIKAELDKYLDMIRHPEKYEALGVKIRKGIIFAGPPGIGKTLMAECFIKDSGLKSYVIRKDRPDGEFVNYIREVFEEAAKNEPSIILLDDMDKYSSEEMGNSDAEEFVAVQSCIDNLKEKDVMVIATVNKKGRLPRSVYRMGRFERIFMMGFPNVKDSDKIVAHYLKDKKIADDLDYEEIRDLMNGESCAWLETVINRAGIVAAYKGHECIMQEDIKEVCYCTIMDIHRHEENASYDVICRRALHEAGHALVDEILNPGALKFAMVSDKKYTVINGMVQGTRLNGLCETLKDFETEIMICLAGKAATEVALGKADVGAFQDISHAEDLVRSFYERYAVYGFNTFSATIDLASEALHQNADISVASDMERYYRKTKKILSENIQLLSRIALELADRKVLTRKDVVRIMNENEADIKAELKAGRLV